MLTLVAVGLVVAAAAAFRGTWSPCGLSMLSTVTPLAESGRGHRYRWTASWFFLGAVLGGATTGSVAAVAAVGIGALDLSAPTTYAIAGVAAVCAAGLDGRLLGPPIPHHRRQVNEDWLGRYRAWVYGAGFGWQIGTGVATYIMSAGVYLVIVLAALTGDPRSALVVCVTFGAVRGSMVLIGARITSAERLARVHERFEAWREPVRRILVGVLALAAGVLAAAGGGPAIVLALASGAVTTAVGAARRLRRGAPAPSADACSIAGTAPV
ncbi:MAG TPA: hypothetical protein PKE05_03720 [Microthrixaceae bacterium]|nr:hypothetical protein [Microthrixaceae bacterium]